MNHNERNCIDSQKLRVYKAERHAFKNLKTVSQKKAKLFFYSVLNSPEYNYAPVEIVFFKGETISGYIYHYASKGKIFLNKTQITIPDILHELAHAVVDCGKGSNPHGSSFCKRYLKFVKLFMSDEDYITLKASFRKYRVDF